jgi:hypothetical protein
VVPLKDLGYASDKELTVYWVNQKHYNIIQVSIKSVNTTPSTTTPVAPPTTPSASDAELLAFWDDWVNPKTSISENFNVKVMMDTANPPAFGKQSSSLEGADPTIVTEITGMCNGPKSIVGRTFYAITLRKSMEFKAKQKGDIALRVIEDGSGDVWRFERGTPVRIKKSAIVRLLAKRNKESEILRRSLIHADYFKKNPDVPEPPPITTTVAALAPATPPTLDPKVLSKTYHHFDDAVLAVIELSKGKGKKINRTTAEKLVLPAWETLIASGNPPDKIDGTMLMNTILSKVKRPTTTTEALINPFQRTNFLLY